jgi:outer membrane receptor protein involved in Fe transport
VKVNSPTTGAFNFAHLTVDQVERVEVLQGSQSPLYGSEALAGVVNIITKRGQEGAGDRLMVEGGSYRTWRTTAVHSDRGPIWDETFSISRSTARGFSQAAERRGNAEPDGYANTSFAARMGRGAGVGGRLDLTVRLTDATADFDDAYPPPTFELADSPAVLRDKAAVLGLTMGARSPVVGPPPPPRLVARPPDHDGRGVRLEPRRAVAPGRMAAHALGRSRESADRRLRIPEPPRGPPVRRRASRGHQRLRPRSARRARAAFFTVGGRTDDYTTFGRRNTYKPGRASP